MSVESKTTPFVIGFDGLHRAGKGTQATLLKESIINKGGKCITLRGDGTRDGLGILEGDPYSEEWQSRSHYLRSPGGSTVENWNAASYILTRELHNRKNEVSGYDALIVDRTILSRAAFLLHRGIILEGTRATLAELYPDNKYSDRPLDLSCVMPDIIFELYPSKATDLLSRLDKNDPKYTFRARNIRGGFYAASIAKVHIPEEIEERVVTLDANESIDIIHNRVKSYLGSTAVSHFLD